MPTHVERLGTRISVPLEPDADGFVGRQCPNEKCLKYFKVTPNTGIADPPSSHCPYCGHTGDSDTFFTEEQIEFAKSIAFRQFTEAFHRDLKSLEFEHKATGPFGIGISTKVTSSDGEPIKYYSERQLETHVVCDQCTLRYAIYGVFGWCPDCAAHNSFQILSKNLELARKQLTLADTVDNDLVEHLEADALENVVSAFDGFARQVCAERDADIHFQNLGSARRRVSEKFALDFADALAVDDWTLICRVFQKRHLIAHKMGVIDDEYVKKANDATAVIGRRVRTERSEVTAAIDLAEKLGKRLFDGLLAVPAPALSSQGVIHGKSAAATPHLASFEKDDWNNGTEVMADITLIENSSAGTPDSVFPAQKVQIERTSPTVSTGIDGISSTGNHLTKIEWHGGNAAALKQVTDIRIVAQGLPVIEAPVNRFYESPRDSGYGSVIFSVLEGE
jgi:hypothetical protein